MDSSSGSTSPTPASGTPAWHSSSSSSSPPSRPRATPDARRSDATAGAAGLSEREARRRLAERPPPRAVAASRSYRSIVVANVFTVFNAILAVAGAVTLALGDWRDALFLGILVANTAIGIGQEVRAKRALDRLAALVAPTATVVRDGASRRVHVDELVPGDLVRVEAGDQVVADGLVSAAEGLELDESILSGESAAVPRAAGERLRSGSFVAEGAGAYVVEAVGAASYAERVAGEARAFRHPRSPLERALNRLLLILVAVMAPLGVLLVSVLVVRDEPTRRAVSTAVAGVLALVPEGLLLLSGLTMAVAALRMARRGVLAQQLNAVESLASVDVLCCDKTGTLTERALRRVGVAVADGGDAAELERAFARYAACWEPGDETLDALAGRDGRVALATEARVPFSSRRRWGAVRLDGTTYVLGAPEALPLDPALAARATREMAAGRRTIALCASSEPIADDGGGAELPARLRPLGLALLAEQLRPNARETLAFLRAEGVEVKVLSGDAPATVAAIVRDLALAPAREIVAVDGRTLPQDDEELAALAAQATVVGRISPEGKHRVVQALAAQGRYVAMIGDGVNDVPALKASRLALAQGSGTQMARAVADLVLVEGDFAVVPQLVAEGRRILRNVQRVAKLFVSKSVFAAVVVLTLGVSTLPYPYLPRHLSLASSFAIGIPAFLLALAPSAGRWRPTGFLREVARFAVPGGLALAASMIAAYLLALDAFGLSTIDARTVATSVLVFVGLYLVWLLERASSLHPRLVGALCVLLGVGYVAMLLLPPARRFFALSAPDPAIVALTAAAVLAGAALARAGVRRAAAGAASAAD
ncbi:MAG: HAD-IC family P-type ATPase [Conexibacter sp.]